MKELDKYEYNLKLEEIDKLVDQRDYEEAANLADTIEWKRVRNVRTLCLISEIYEAAGRLEDSKKILERAYRRSPVGKNVLYRLVEVTTALRQYDEALEYYTEYVQAAPHDNNRYILKYKLYRGRGSATEELIAILEEYLGQEYTERWAYELARLYREAGQMQKCLAACDDLVLWFHSGKYVLKALELKKKYAVLTPKQQQIYEECMQEEAELNLEREEEAEQESEPEESVVVNMESTDGEVMAERIIAETEKEIAEDITACKAGLEEQSWPTASVQRPESAADAERHTKVMPNLSAAVGKEQTVAQEALDTAKMEAVSEAENAKAPGDAEGKAAAESTDEAATVAENVRGALKHALKRASEPEPKERETQPQAVEQSDAKESFDREELQMNLARSMREIVSGVAKQPEMPEEDMPASVESRPRMTQKVEVPGVSIPSPGRLSIDDILLSMGDKGKEIASKTAEAKQKKLEEEAQKASELSAVQSEEMTRQKDSVLEQETDEEWPEAADRYERRKTVADAAVEDLTDAQREALQYTSNPEKLLRNKRSLPTYTEESDVLGATRRVPSREELMEAARQELMAEKTIRIPAEEVEKHLSGRRRKQDDGTAEEAYIQMPESENPENNYSNQPESEREEENRLDQPEDGYLEDSYLKRMKPDGSEDDFYDESEVPEQEEAAEPYPEEDGCYEEYGDYLMIPEHLRGLFSGFTEIPELEDQIANAIIQAQSKGDDRTSKTGNILIFGAHGSGKTTMAMNLAKAITQDRGGHVVKMARIYATDLNKKDIAATVAKIAGGILIVEEAGDLEDDTVEQLTTAMEFRTDGLIMILEDEQKYIHELLMRHPRFTMKFTAQIYIPEYTVEELAMFGQIYANEQDYMIGEEGLDALCGRISALADVKAESQEAVAISDVIEMVGKAIERSNGFFRKMKMGRKRYDENDYILLFAKDFK